MANNRILALLAAFGASAIYGINHTIAKGVMPLYIEPFGFILLRVSGAAILFWLLSFFAPKEKIANSDWPRIVGCAIFGMVINMLFFFKGLSMSTPINSSVIITLSPVMVLILAAILIGERITLLKSLGIIIGLAGALVLILFSKETGGNGENIPLGNMLFIVNAFSYGLYLILVKPLTQKYHSITLMKWLFLIAIFINLPVTYSEFVAVDWANLPFDAIWKLSYVVLGTTFMTYLLNIYALKQLSAATISAFIYLQPLIAISFAIAVGADELNMTKAIAALLVFVGVYMVSIKKKSKKAAVTD
ncbi:DMT family transporter [Christiangramia flava]|uniref:Permease of the drug/metabolite transporter (DMT) superfamily n=1 Tax=Christiangramia flava JLT2011 TaxID=1229726 RepID=A0A1L7I526_9FLAO|nr:DMT family transporter [Christiangramia flava]APU68273.1 Permease of the drug/metabolite transporter (DMT) superfamily [Christiangramia flava JLT2011]OSS40940.1 Permease of the drug/metabolite transporter (DMT) superfamily [Christiangramia flava JLT2011]